MDPQENYEITSPNQEEKQEAPDSVRHDSVTHGPEMQTMRQEEAAETDTLHPEPTGGKKKLLIRILLVIVVLAAAVLIALRLGLLSMLGIGGAAGFGGAPGMGGASGQGGRGQSGGTQTASYAIVKTGTPTYGNVSVTSSLTGTVEAADVVYVYAKASGDVTAVYVRAGDYITAGDLICEIDTEQIESAKNSMESAQISLSQAESTLSRMQILYSGGDITDQEYEQYNNSVKSSRLQYENAKLNYERQLEYSSVTAPISGRVESCDVEVYDHIGNQSQLCVISGEGENRIEFYVSERMMQHLRTGDAVEVSKNGRTYEGRISEISTMVDSQTGLFKCRATLEETDEIAIGSSVKLRLVTDRSENVLLVPVDAIYYSGGNGYVYTVEEGVARMTPVEVGLYDESVAEIKGGLGESDLVVSTWSSNLYEGAFVRTLEEVQAEKDAAGATGASGAGGADGNANAENASFGDPSGRGSRSSKDAGNSGGGFGGSPGGMGGGPGGPQ